MADTVTRTARCVCGALSVTVSGAPITVQACSCGRCQRRSGSAFSYTAFWPKADARIEGAFRTWRDTAESGFWVEVAFCPACGSHVFGHVEAWPETIGIAVGAFAAPDFPAPTRLCWAAGKHAWLTLPPTVTVMETQ